MSKEYDVYYSTGGGSMVGGGADVWVNNWIEEIAPHLKVKPKLLIHRTKPNKPLTQEQTHNFEKSVSADRGGNTGRQVHQKIKKNYKEILKDELEHHWQGEDKQKFRDLLANARRIHILHGYYAPHKYILDNKDRIYSNGVHVCVMDCFRAPFILDVKTSYHFHMVEHWEKDICEIAKHPFWIGVTDKKLDVPTEWIPNYYEFKHNLDVNDSNEIGFASRMETRKCPHFLSGMEAIVHTSRSEINFWKKWNNLASSKWKVYGFNYEFHDKFMGKDWGISHSAHIYEPFGYSIFQAVDYGKVPILAEDWLPQYKYPLRASNPKDFKLQYERICKMGLDERRDILFPLREYLTEHFGNKQRWVEQMLRIYNS